MGSLWEEFGKNAKHQNIVIAIDRLIVGNNGNYFLKLNIFHKNIVII